MAEGMNRVILFGNLGADPDLRATAGGTSVLKLRLATSENYKDKAGQWQERTEWHRVACFGRRAEALWQMLNNGDRILVEGSLRTSSYEDRDGNKRYTTEVVASNVVLAGGKSRERESEKHGSGSAGSQGGSHYDDGVDDDIPFATCENINIGFSSCIDRI